MSNKGSKKKKGSILDIGQSLTIDNTGDVLQKYKASIDKNDSVILASDSIETIDLSGIQLILAIMQDAKKGVNSTLNIKFSESSKDIIEKCGFDQIL